MAYLTIDAGGTYIKSAVMNSKGETLDGPANITPSFSESSQENILCVFEKIITCSLRLIEANDMRLEGIGLAFPGPFDYNHGVPLMKHKFEKIFGINLRDKIYEFSGLRNKVPVKFVHDANSVLMGELWKGNAQFFANAAVITLGTGLGFSFSQNKIVQTNDKGGPLLSIYNIPYKQGILEDYASKRGFLRLYQEKNKEKKTNHIKVSDLGKWADQGEKESIQTFHEVAMLLAISLKDILIEKNIQCLLFGGQISKSFGHMEGALTNYFKKSIGCLEMVKPVKNIDNASLFGALQAVLDEPIKSEISSI